MNNNKEIGAVFKDRLEGYKDTPDDFVWANITSELNQKKKNWTKRIIIILILVSLLALTIHLKLKKTALKSIDKTEKLNNNNPLKIIQKEKALASYISIEDKRKGKENNLASKKAKHKSIDKKVALTHETTLIFKHGINTKKSYTKLKAMGIKPYKNTNSIYILNKNTYKNQSKKSKSKISITANFGVNHFSSLSNLNDIYSNKLGSNTTNNSFSYNYGMYFNYRINNNILIRLGIQKLRLKNSINNIQTKNINNQISTTLKQSGISFISNNNDIFNFIGNDNLFNITQELNYLEFPLEMKYQILKGRYNLSTIIGYSMIYQENNTIYISTSKNEKLDIGYNNLFNDKASSLNLGVSSELNLFKNTYLNLELNYKKYFNLQNKSAGLPYSIGLQIGFNYKF
ncbi:hypothetical protein DS884_11925 [Tenacibaculum sp. E3R01]|uniref:hypothetical protein n=1 Tax=Tenacibaculum sp. E3R01 TaxID=2267227 RepID=UPI000DEA7347|nr:hypothetical protein [Tenacibaculum sp. E3R01]RBW57280.1 hypothetical protein DS884_11925 [Tenacibaculum sp. E3R01]